MLTAQSLPWTDPLELASAIDEPCMALLYSGTMNSDSGRFSLLACGLDERLESGGFNALAAKLSTDRSPMDNAWFGYLGYGLKNTLESLSHDTPGPLTLPDICMMRFKCIFHFDHVEKTLNCWGDMPPRALPAARGKEGDASLPSVTQISSNMTTEAYLAKAAEIIALIHRGELYQANLTRKFMGEFSQPPDGLSLFKKLCEASPAAYSAYLRIGDTHIISSSPELFLSIAADGNICSRPIKGSAPRGSDAGADAALRRQLADSEKDRAENLMIVDLMRNDFARSCRPGSVRTDRLFEITSHATIHHLSSSISGALAAGMVPLEAVKACFPPGSMTGAPKIRAMELCSRLEQMARGIYSGAIGWFGGDGSCELSVVIRTVVVQGSYFEFQVGGGIVADSTPAQELQEHLDKAAGILKALDVPASRLKAL